MAVSSKANATAVFDLKSAALTVLALLLKTADLDRLAQALSQRLGAEAFQHEPLCVDLAALREADAAVDFPALVALLRRHGFNPIAVRAGSAAQVAAAAEAGLVEAPEGPAPREREAEPADAAAPAALASAAPVAESAPEPAAAAPAEPVATGARTLIIDKPLRSGQQVYARGGDLIVMAVVSFGAEVIADGNIHVYAPLRGRALAGARGDTNARIFAAVMEPQLVSIAGTWRNLETHLSPEVAGKPAQVRLDGDKLLFEPLKF